MSFMIYVVQNKRKVLNNMNEVKQIEEIARTLCKDYNTEKCVTRCANYGKCTVGIDANTFYFAGYRKQSEGGVDFQ